jgi:predicted nucleic acid-binding protein
MYTVDASVWVNAFDQREPGHEASRRFLQALQAHALPVVVPNLLCVEVAGAISRTRNEPVRTQEFATAVADLPNVSLLSLDEELAQVAWDLAAKNGSRGADAVYAAVALSANCTLVSLDQEHLTRLTAVVPARAPAAALSEMEELLAAEMVPAEANSGAASKNRDVEDQSETSCEPEVVAEALPEALRYRQLARAIEECLKTLIRPRRLAVTLYLQGHRIKETARLLGWNEKRTENLIYRGREDLRECLQKKGLVRRRGHPRASGPRGSGHASPWGVWGACRSGMVWPRLRRSQCQAL